ncbi:sigma-54-dependent Fis family transcriptional regulator [Bacillus sp. FJAT-42315]|uniref:sigma-54-dependent Fis family transcriptional regulator n=1 Tax=Bacillus sp. FJAT-42315 TaxID=2014077 RepID=UPI000C24C1A4|nr:sigma-54-dependent Fis family transcriptional regulator [Bacillus sp. FJAT-42315]
MTHIKDIMTPITETLRETSTLKEALVMMKENKWNTLPVTDNNRQLIGVFTRSSLYQMVLNEQPLSMSIKGYIIDQPVTLPEDMTFEEVAEVVKVSKVGTGIVLDQEEKVVGLATKTDIVRALMFKRKLDTAIEHAYDGIIMIDEQSNIEMVNPALLELFNLKQQEVLQQPVDRVFPHFHLSKALHTEEAEFSDFMEVNGIKYIVHRIPILQDQKVIGVLGKVMYRQLNEVSILFKKLEKAESKAAYYLSELKKSEQARFTWEQIITEDRYVDKLKKSAAKAAKGRSTILVRGESGTGKELFAHAIHASSARKDGPFVEVNCAAIPEQLLESEFFGYEEGAFTGANRKGKIGKFDLANGGTLFLDEVGDMSLVLQAKLLRVIQDREFYRVGGTERVHVDVRIIAATNRPLEEMVKNGEFREDLYYRLNVISLHIPPLRERRGDVKLLINHIMKQLNRVLSTSVTGIESNAFRCLLHYDWPGNVRELKNILERAMTFAETGNIQTEDLPEYLTAKVETASLSHNQSYSITEQAEMSAIQKVMEEVNGNKAKAARLLGISRSGLYEKLKRYQL